MIAPRPQTPPSSPAPAFTGARLDRAAKLRTSSSAVAELFASPRARAVLCRADAVAVTRDGAGLARVALPKSLPLPPLLGLESGAPLFGVDLDCLDEETGRKLVGAERLVELRDAGASLPREEGGLAAYLMALSKWHRHHRFCANCGAATDAAHGGLSRHCPRCRRRHFPRTDPVVIMLVEHDDRLLLGRRPGWPQGRYSLLAGFVASGETPEEAVAREVREESGLEASGARYVTAQPWPFPASLMLGFTAVSAGGDPHCADGELEDVRWFGRDQVQAACREDADWSIRPQAPDQLLLPPRAAIARSLIEWWLEAATSDQPE